MRKRFPLLCAAVAVAILIGALAIPGLRVANAQCVVCSDYYCQNATTGPGCCEEVNGGCISWGECVGGGGGGGGVRHPIP